MVRAFQGLPQTTQPIDINFGCLTEVEVLIAEDMMHFGQRTPSILAEFGQKTSSLRIVFHTPKRYFSIVLYCYEAHEPQ